MSSDLPPGTPLGRYQIRSRLGKGGMGEVYLADDTQLGRLVAIKLLPPETTSDEHARKRLVREARALATLDHPNICSVYEVGEADCRSFIAMQYIEGETLDLRLKRKPVELKETLTIATHIADALTEAHTHGIIHRDIKPSNVIITSRGQAKVMDFGLAKVIQQAHAIESEAETEALLSTFGAILGTVPYMSPEQVRSEALDARSDIFSLGVVLYEMLSGRQPFARQSAASTVSAILTHEPPPLARYALNVPEELQRIVRKCLEKDRERRCQTMRDVALDLENVLRQNESLQDVPRSSRQQQATGGAAGTLTTSHKRTTRKAIDSLAVLPLDNMSNDPDMEYLSDGITESLINTLLQLPKLRVVSRSTVFRYKGQKIDLGEVRQQLGVRAVLTGRVRRVGDRLMIGTELIDVVNDTQLWGDHYNRKMSDVFEVQEEIAREISEKLLLKLSGKEKQRLSKRHTNNPEAYQLYLKGRYFWNRRSEDGIKRSIEYFNQAIALDPSYALAYAGLADSYALLGCGHEGRVPPKDVYPRARAAAMRALEIDDTLAEAHTSLGFVKKDYEWEFAGAEREFKRAIELNPNYATAHHWYAESLVVLGRLAEAITVVNRAQELDPLSLMISAQVGWVLYHVRQYDQAIEQYRRTLEIDPDFWIAHLFLGLVYEQKGRYEEAIAEFQKAESQSGGHIEASSSLGYVYAVSGKRDEAQKILDELKGRIEKEYLPPFGIALIYTGLGDKDRAFEWLEKAYEERDLILVYYLRFPQLDSLRSDPRFTDLLRRMGLN